jgi:hypothetical protein
LDAEDYADLRRQVIADGMDAGVLDQLESLKNVRTWEQFLQAKGSHAGAIAAGNQLGQTYRRVAQHGTRGVPGLRPDDRAGDRVLHRHGLRAV